MAEHKCAFVFAMFLCSALSGCMFFEEDADGFDLEVNVSSSEETIVETYSFGNLDSTTKASVLFNFSNTDSELTLIGVDRNDGGQPVEMLTEESYELSVDFTSHGKYNVTVYAINEDDVREEYETQITVNLQIDWIENSTSDPLPLEFDPIPKYGGEHPLMIEILSEVHNPSVLNDFSGGQSVQFSWTITDELGDTCQRNDAEVSDGETELWNTIHFNTYLVHELGIIYDEGQDLIDVKHQVLLIYDSD